MNIAAASAAPTKTPSAWETEWKRFKDLRNKWIESQLNKFFDLSIRGPKIRNLWVAILGILFVIFGFTVHLFLYYLPIVGAQRHHSLADLFVFAVLTIAQLILILFIPAQAALNMAGNYLADIFELKDPRVAWKFIRELSLGGAAEVVHIRDGMVVDKDKNSPIILIGGPGRVEVDFDSAVLFEKPDGTPHVIGPEPKKPEEEQAQRRARKKKSAEEKDNAVLDGFERLREPIINLRDQFFGTPSSEALSVESRSLDGIKISAKDVRVVFSVRRESGTDSQKPTSERPYLYNRQSIQDLIYQQAVQVKTEGPHPSGEPGPWTATFRGLVLGDVSRFMSQNKLAEYLASISTPEIEEAEHREDTILLETLQYSNEAPASSTSAILKPQFHPRTELSDRFMKYAEGFSKQARERGYDLHWIGVGTWKVPNEMSSQEIAKQHLDAWRISRENAALGSQSALNSVMEEAALDERLRLIREVPFHAHQSNLSQYNEKDKLLEALLYAYREQLGNALETYYKAGTRTEELKQIEEAVLAIEDLLGIPAMHTVGGGSLSKVKRASPSPSNEDTPPAPQTKREEELYRSLLIKLDGNYKAVETLIALEAQRYPALTRQERLERIVRRFERHQKSPP
jgi:hypothetical protein